MTESDNITHDLYKYLAVGSIMSSITLSAVSVFKGAVFDPQSYGIGMGSLFAGVGVALGLKKDNQGKEQ